MIDLKYKYINIKYFFNWNINFKIINFLFKKYLIKIKIIYKNLNKNMISKIFKK